MNFSFFRRFLSRTTLTISKLILLLSFFTACGQNDDQRDFEREAFRPPQGYTETDASGQIAEENDDPDDWRTSPFFQGLVFVDPVFPNPVQVSDQLSINVDISGIEAVSGLTVIVLIDSGANAELRPVYNDTRQPLPPGLTVINLNPVQLGRFNTAESARGLHRIILLDGRENVITYGDVMVE